MKCPFQIIVTITAVAVASIAATARDRPTQFWNLTRNTISEFYLAPAGTTNWGPNQCKNDPDGNVDADERLRITDVPSGTYDAKLADVTGRTCTVHDIKIELGSIFHVEERTSNRVIVSSDDRIDYPPIASSTSHGMSPSLGQGLPNA